MPDATFGNPEVEKEFFDLCRSLSSGSWFQFNTPILPKGIIGTSVLEAGFPGIVEATYLGFDEIRNESRGILGEAPVFEGVTKEGEKMQVVLVVRPQYRAAIHPPS